METTRMRKIVRSIYVVPIILLPLMLALSAPVLAQSGDSSPKPIVLTDKQGRYPLGLNLEILKDPSTKLTIQDISSPAYDSHFIPSRVQVPNYGFSDSAYWVRFDVKNSSSRTDHWLLELGFPSIQYADLYYPASAGKGWIVKRSGISRPFNSREVSNPNIVFELPLPTAGESIIYIRFQSGSSMTLPLTIWLPET